MGYNIIVCIKQVLAADTDLSIDDTGKDIKKDDLVSVINEWDNYAAEEAVKLKEKYGGSVTAITIGSEKSDEVLRRALAMGADEAIRLTDPALEGSDGYATAKALSKIIKGKPYNIILTGVQAEDNNYGLVGPALAEILGITHATLVSKIESIDNGKIKLHRELEGGLEEVLEVETPLVLTVQTGINKPKYISIMGIKKVAKKPINTPTLNDLGISPEEVGEKGSFTTVEKAYLPETGKTAEILQGTPEEINTKLVSILKEKGGK